MIFMLCRRMARRWWTALKPQRHDPDAIVHHDGLVCDCRHDVRRGGLW